MPATKRRPAPTPEMKADMEIRIALSLTKPFRCSDCGGRAVVTEGHVRVAHDLEACPLGVSVRRRHPRLFQSV